MVLNPPGVESAEEEDDQTNNALSIPPLHMSLGAVTRWFSGVDMRHETQQAGVTLSIYTQYTALDIFISYNRL